jgi:predicted dehydrogenase
MKSTEQPAPFGVAVLGAGAMGKHHARVFASTAGFRLAGVFDVHPERAAATAELHGARAFGSEDEALEVADVVVVATPISAHAATIRRALGRGAHVLVEKPLCARAAEADALGALGGRAGARLWVGHSERFNPVVRALAASAPGHAIRDLHLWRVAPPPAKPARHGVLTDLGVHDLDLVAHLTGGACSVVDAHAAWADSATVGLVASTGATARVHVSRRGTRRSRLVAARTHEAVFRGDLLGLVLVREDARTGRVDRLRLDPVEPLAAQAAALRDAIEGHASTCATGCEGARAVSLAEQAEKLSIARSSWYPQRYGSMG